MIRLRWIFFFWSICSPDPKIAVAIPSLERSLQCPKSLPYQWFFVHLRTVRCQWSQWSTHVGNHLASPQIAPFMGKCLTWSAKTSLIAEIPCDYFQEPEEEVVGMEGPQ